MGTNNVVFLEVLEWLDDTGNHLVKRDPVRSNSAPSLS